MSELKKSHDRIGYKKVGLWVPIELWGQFEAIVKGDRRSITVGLIMALEAAIANGAKKRGD